MLPENHVHIGCILEKLCALGLQRFHHHLVEMEFGLAAERFFQVREHACTRFEQIQRVVGLRSEALQKAQQINNGDD